MSGAQPETSSSPPRAAPRWDTVVTFSGTGPFQSPEFTVLSDAIQWRVRWSCQGEGGHIRITTTPPPRRPGPIVDQACPGNGDGYSIQTGPSRLGIETGGPWKAIVDQQVETPMTEPPPPGAASARVLAEGSFYDIEKSGKGTATLYQLDGGRRVLRFEDFEVTSTPDLFVWLSQAREPKTSKAATEARHVDLGNIKSTVGSQNYEVPASVPTSEIRSIVIWCEPVAVAYAAAAMSA